MAFNSTSKTGNQYLFTGRGPLDPKTLIATYAELLNRDTWTENNSIIAYNGMIVAVWCNTADTTKNGIYFLHDSTVQNRFKAPDVTNEANWHKLGSVDDLPGLNEQIKTIQTDLTQLKGAVDELQENATETFNCYDDLPRPGVVGKLYIATEEAITYIWHNDDYLPVGDGSGDTTSTIDVILGGGPNG